MVAPLPTADTAGMPADNAVTVSEHSICVGDMISLFIEDLNGFLSADGFTEDSLNVQCLCEDEICVQRFESCVFQASRPFCNVFRFFALIY